ncbi:histidinol-phosphate aminotransferase [Oscillochloris trichoides DG-6]|uniref:Histidinol-phosphate aminotransferase n=1 Tax=Oscillochloris trichoides DG-6 TaxID=765420 RepID=E1ICL2_9CHLR|nr:histidinol-phosphate transaminase [Oscillochloris trichoides]EFO81079.1 histidinol-phosphate aminotransferase [Oscillochloris trichoides DG-6]
MHYKDHILNLPAYKSATLLAGPSAELVKLSSNENPLGPSPMALAALGDALHGIHRYPDSGAAALRHALAARDGLDARQVTCSNGSDEMILLLCLGMLNPGDEAVMADGTFISYLLRTLELGGRAVRVPLRNYTHDLEAMADAINERTRLVFVCNPNNPTGTSNGAEEMRSFLQRVPDDVLVVMDEAYIEFVERPDYPDLLDEVRSGRPNLILLRTFAKIYGLAGLRLGYAYGAPELISYLDRVRPTFNVNLLAQVAGLAAIQDTEHVRRSREHASASRAFYMRELRALGLEPIASETNFVAFAIPGDDAAMGEALRQRGYTVTTLAGWGLPGHIRISFGTDAQNQGMIAALRDALHA